MSGLTSLAAKLNRFPRATVAHLPTPIEEMKNLGSALGLDLWVKRDDCTGLGFGGNKIRQLEFYFGEAVSAGADTILITGAVQSNYVRAAAAMARRLGLACHIQLEDRVPGMDDTYHCNGNVLLDHLLGASITHVADGENEDAADAQMAVLAAKLAGDGRRPYIISPGENHPPLGALGYVVAAQELAEQLSDQKPFDEIIVASGSGLTHGGLLFGLRACGQKTGVRGICVRRPATDQSSRLVRRIEATATLLGNANPVTSADICVSDAALAPGYGQISDAVRSAIVQTAQAEGLFLDPVYTGKSMAGLIDLASKRELSGKRVLFWHTGGTPALFGYGQDLLADR